MSFTKISAQVINHLDILHLKVDKPITCEELDALTGYVDLDVIFSAVPYDHGIPFGGRDRALVLMLELMRRICTVEKVSLAMSLKQHITTVREAAARELAKGNCILEAPDFIATLRSLSAADIERFYEFESVTLSMLRGLRCGSFATAYSQIAHFARVAARSSEIYERHVSASIDLVIREAKSQVIQLLADC